MPLGSPNNLLLDLSWGALGTLLGALGAVLGLSWAPLGALLGPLGAIWRARKAIGSERASMLKSLIFFRFWKDLGILGASLGGSVATWSRLEAVLGHLGSILESILSQLGPYCTILEAI